MVAGMYSADEEVDAVAVSAWIGCLACYNGGTLVGEWVSWPQAERFEPCTSEDHEESWVFDHELPRGILAGECSPAEFARLGAILEQFSGNLAHLDAVAGYLGISGSVTEIEELVAEWDETVEGPYEDAIDLASQHIEALGGVSELPEATIEAYFDVAAFGRDIVMERSTVELPGGQLLLLWYTGQQPA